MALLGFERDTLLDLTVNVIPLGIMVFFIGLFLVVPAFGTNVLFSTLQFLLIFVHVVLLAILTYYAGRAIEGAEEEERNAQQASAVEEPPGEVTGLDDTGVEDERALEDGESDDN
ncbi:DUF6684 family protein [Haloarcula nitratireducens]|uniref:DUF6684 family protein n=1 Tax=Haloarcula nitratireducens TaxID=2487749 RepID=UPI001F3C3759|nr:DUF6684 family protein [Halomicroarcula nitratireducens]